VSFLSRLLGRPSRARGRHAGPRGVAAVPGARPLQPPAAPAVVSAADHHGSGGSVVALIYRDGSSLAYAAADPRARAYRTLADHLAARG